MLAIEAHRDFARKKAINLEKVFAVQTLRKHSQCGKTNMRIHLLKILIHEICACRTPEKLILDINEEITYIIIE